MYTTVIFNIYLNREQTKPYRFKKWLNRLIWIGRIDIENWFIWTDPKVSLTVDDGSLHRNVHSKWNFWISSDESIFDEVHKWFNGQSVICRKCGCGDNNFTAGEGICATNLYIQSLCSCSVLHKFSFLFLYIYHTFILTRYRKWVVRIRSQFLFFLFLVYLPVCLTLTC